MLGVLPGIAVAIGLSLINFVRRSARPHTAVLGQVDDHDGFHTLERFPSARTAPGLVVFRFDAPLFFANANWFADQIRGLVASGDPPVRWVVLDAAGITDIDTTAADVLVDLVHDLTEAGSGLMVADPPGRVLDQLDRYGLTGTFGANRFFDTVDQAVAACDRDAGP